MIASNRIYLLYLLCFVDVESQTSISQETHQHDDGDRAEPTQIILKEVSPVSSPLKLNIEDLTASVVV